MSTDRESSLEGGGLRVRFAWRGDRYTHEISWFDGRDWTDVLNSVEGSPLDAWPASPPLQSLHFESRPGNRELALLVGMAGKSHWSVSIELDPAVGLKFDVACRARGPLGSLGSSYRSPQPSELSLGGAVFSSGQATRLALQTCPELGESRLALAPDGLNIIAQGSATAQAQTIRWGYTISRVI